MQRTLHLSPSRCVFDDHFVSPVFVRESGMFTSRTNSSDRNPRDLRCFTCSDDVDKLSVKRTHVTSRARKLCTIRIRRGSACGVQLATVTVIRRIHFQIVDVRLKRARRGRTFGANFDLFNRKPRPEIHAQVLFFFHFHRRLGYVPARRDVRSTGLWIRVHDAFVKSEINAVARRRQGAQLV